MDQWTDVSTIPSDLDDAALAAELTRRASHLALHLRAEGLTSRSKSNLSDVVTEADHAAEEFVVSALTLLRPGDGIVGEEGANAASRTGRTWVIDPVDGTYNFLSGTAYWCSAIALRDDEGVILGSVHQPAVGEAWLGGRDLPTQCNGVTLDPLEDLPLAEVALATYIHPTRFADAALREPWLAAARGAATIRMLGSGSCDLAAVSAGRFGAWAQQSVPDWDWLPGSALVLAAGGEAVQVETAGATWSVAGRPTAVRQVIDALTA
ncbi:inositol monophosphatase [Janibacter sp. GXQ6167]|uniref:inositol monophosphatase family protein n=1 Tax=Janibacter sp. GXQ6167 TaxID=3240791 RepID=UPI003523A0FC